MNNTKSLPSITPHAGAAGAPSSLRGATKRSQERSNGERTQSAPSSDEVKVGKLDTLRTYESLPLIAPSQPIGSGVGRPERGREHIATVLAFAHQDFHQFFGPGALSLTFGWIRGLGLTVVKNVPEASEGSGARRHAGSSALQPEPNDVLVAINGITVSAGSMDFAGVVALMKKNGKRDRDLVFRRFEDFNAAANAGRMHSTGCALGDQEEVKEHGEGNTESNARAKIVESKAQKWEEGKGYTRKKSKIRTIKNTKTRGIESKVSVSSQVGSPKGKRRKAKRMHSLVDPLATLQYGLQQMQNQAKAAAVKPKKIKTNPFIGKMCKRTKSALEENDYLKTVHVSVS